MSAKIILEQGSLSGLEFELKDQAEWTLGRDPDLSSLVVEDPTVSGKQLLLQQTDHGILLKNLSEDSSTYVNGLEAKEPILLKDGDTVTIGTQTFRYVEQSDAKERYQENPYELQPTEEAMSSEEPTTETTENQPMTDSPSADNDVARDAALQALTEAQVDHPENSVEESHDSIFDEDKNVTLSNNGLAQINFDLLDSGRYLLKVVGGPNNGAEFSMQAGHTYLIGTDPNTCDILFHDTSVSRQHTKISVDDDEVIHLEDLKSRNGTLLEGKAIDSKTTLATNTLVTVGTTSFVIYDREGNMQTIISPLLPDIVKVLSKEEPREDTFQPVADLTPAAIPSPKEKPLGAFVAIAIITGLFVVMAIGTTALFRSEPIELIDSSNADTQLAAALEPFKSVKYSFNKATGRLLLVGHVLTQTDKNQLLYNLQGMKFVKNIDDNGVVIDELVWQNTNTILNKNPAWKGISIQAPAAGQFVLTGYLQTRKQADQIYDYMTANFPYLDRLERSLVIEDDVVQTVSNMLGNNGIRSVNVQFTNGELTLTGGVPAGKNDIYAELQNEFKKIPGIRQVRSQVANLVTDQSTMNISDRYEVSGYSKQGNRINVVINGRIVTKGDSLDGMTIRSIAPNTILLDKDGMSYRIDYNR